MRFSIQQQSRECKEPTGRHALVSSGETQAVRQADEAAMRAWSTVELLMRCDLARKDCHGRPSPGEHHLVGLKKER